MSKLNTLESDILQNTKEYYKQRDIIYQNLFNDYNNIEDRDCYCRCCRVDKKIQKKYKKQLLDLIIKYDESLPELNKSFYNISEILIIVLAFLNFLNEMSGPIAHTNNKLFNSELNNQNISHISAIYFDYDKAIDFSIFPKRQGNVFNIYSCIKTIINIIDYHVTGKFVYIRDKFRLILDFSFENENDGILYFKMKLSEGMSQEEFNDCTDFYDYILDLFKSDKRLYYDIFNIIEKFICN